MAFGSVWAQDVQTVTYALAVGDEFTSGQEVSVTNDADEVVAKIVYGEEGGANFKSAKADSHVNGFTAFTEGNGVNGDKTNGTFYTITPSFDGTIDVAVVLNSDKAFFIMEDGVALNNYNGIKVEAKYYGTYTFPVKKGKKYKIYCAGSKLGFYGFNYNIGAEDTTPTIEPLMVTENNTEVVLSKTEVDAHGYLTATENWTDEKTYGKEKEYTGQFFNMSRPNRTLTITEKGAIAFEIFVQNGTAGRTYTYKVDNATETTITHNGNSVESSGIIECSSDQITITLAGTDASVYPVAIKFYTELPISVPITAAKYATLYYSDKALVVPSGIKAYTIGRIDSKNVVKKGTEYAKGETIPAGEAVILEGTPDVYSFVIDAESTSAPTEGNLLKGSDEAAQTTGGDKYYKLAVKDDVVGFYYGAEDGGAFENGAHKAYLAVSEEAAAKFYVFDGQATGINTVAKITEEGAIYNLQGVRVDAQNMVKGIYVVNGKKVVIK